MVVGSLLIAHRCLATTVEDQSSSRPPRENPSTCYPEGSRTCVDSHRSRFTSFSVAQHSTDSDGVLSLRLQVGQGSAAVFGVYCLRLGPWAATGDQEALGNVIYSWSLGPLETQLSGFTLHHFNFSRRRNHCWKGRWEKLVF